MRINHLLYEFLRRIYIKILGPNLSKDGQMYTHSRVVQKMQYSESQELLKELLLRDKPCFIARLGSIELGCFNNWQQVVLAKCGKRLGGGQFKVRDYITDKSYASWIQLNSKNGMAHNAGFFPATEINLYKYGERINHDILEIDLLSSWWKHEIYLPIYDKVPKIEVKYITYPFYYANPWTSCLKGKKVLVVSSFSQTIKRQYSIREKLFANQNVLPEFELITLQSYNVLREMNNTDAKDWFDALHKMEETIKGINFDIALLGCGAYAIPLGAYCKRLGKKAVTICGGIQLLFGIIGKRWEKELRKDGIINEYWTRPMDEKPFGYEKVENGCYW